jgi:hypothetical protein
MPAMLRDMDDFCLDPDLDIIFNMVESGFLYNMNYFLAQCATNVTNNNNPYNPDWDMAPTKKFRIRNTGGKQSAVPHTVQYSTYRELSIFFIIIFIKFKISR